MTPPNSTLRAHQHKTTVALALSLATVVGALACSPAAPRTDNGDSTRLDHGSGDAFNPDIAVHPDGRATVVWAQGSTSTNKAYARHYDPVMGDWGEPGAIGPALGVYRPMVEIGDDGRSLAAWIHREEGAERAFASYYNPNEGGWEPHVRLGSEYAEHERVDDIAIDHESNAYVMWSSLGYGVGVRRFDAETQRWGDTTWLQELEGDTDTRYGVLAVDAEGNVFAGWNYLNDYSGVQVRRYDVKARTWGAAVAMESPVQGEHGAPDLAVDPAGDAMFVWAFGLEDEEVSTIWAKRYDASADEWGASVALEGAGDSPWPGVRVVLDNDGNAFVVWTLDDTLYSSQFLVDSGEWTPPVAFESQYGQRARDHQLLVTADGVAVVLWVGVELTDNSLWDYYLFWSRFTPKTGGFSAPQALDLGKDYKAWPRFGADGLGHVMAAWHEDGICCGEFSDTYSSIWTARWRY